MDLSGSGEDIFYDSMLEGNAYKEIIKMMLLKSGYSVYQYGYESTFSDVKSKLTKETRASKSARAYKHAKS
jgi:hypothetical protein